MAKKESYLKLICENNYGVGSHRKLSDIEMRTSRYYDEVMAVYKRLGGVLSEIPLRVGPYDIDTHNFIIEFDEENHFNRYRLSTLESSLYTDNRNIPINDYKKYCKHYEDRCCTHGKYACNDSTDKQFGKSLIDGDLSGVNRSRWKQRAFYDFIKDITSIITGIPIIRISIYDRYKGYTIEELVHRKNKSILIEYIDNRLQDLEF